MKGLFVTVNDFDVSRLCTRGAIDAPVPEGIAPAKQIEINYKYPVEGEKDIESRLVLLCPSFKTYKGIQASKQISDGKPGKPAIRINFDSSNPDHRKMLGSFGTKHIYRSRKGSVERVNEKYEEPSGVFGSIYDWCVNQYAKFLSDKAGEKYEEGDDEVDIAYFLKASDPETGIKKKDFVYEPKPTDGEQGKKELSHGKFLKLLTYKPGTPEENMAKFYLPDKSKADFSHLYDQGFEFSPFLSFRRIFIGGNGPSVTMEVTESVITDFLAKSDDISAKSLQIISKINSFNPNAASEIAAKYRSLMHPEESGENLEKPPQQKLKVECESEPDFIDPKEEDSKPTVSLSKPKLPASLFKPKTPSL